ncbi:hypothetical protein AB7C87_16635 [Natrarchaeobius sp. A-rgal3]|uniref:hypothetical protein n=1 Tax=Natrarchaeobius versutus TaxID=1679078 RepID=UPI00350F53F3
MNRRTILSNTGISAAMVAVSGCTGLLEDDDPSSGTDGEATGDSSTEDHGERTDDSSSEETGETIDHSSGENTGAENGGPLPDEHRTLRCPVSDEDDSTESVPSIDVDADTEDEIVDAVSELERSYLERTDTNSNLRGASVWPRDVERHDEDAVVGIVFVSRLTYGNDGDEEDQWVGTSGDIDSAYLVTNERIYRKELHDPNVEYSAFDYDLDGWVTFEC